MVKLFGWALSLELLACGLLGCGATEMTATGPAEAPLAPTCDFEILTSTPLLGYQEIGTIDVTPGAYGVNQFTNLSDFKDHIRPNVCQLGGDAAIASANGYGMYIKASVMKHVVVKPAPAAVAEAPSPRSHGCEFDSQCKGDRICVGGKCEAPAASVAPAASASAAAPVAPAQVASAASPATKTPTSAAVSNAKTTAASAPKAAANSAH